MNNLLTYLGVPILILLLALVSPLSGLKCYQCGYFSSYQNVYCGNISDLKATECPYSSAKYCAKYVEKEKTIRRCEDKCSEKKSDSGLSTYCCEGNGCNSATVNTLASTVGTMMVAAVAWSTFRRGFSYYL